MTSNRELARQLGVSENVAALMELYPVGERFFQEFTPAGAAERQKTDQGYLPLALPAGRRARILPGLPRRRPALRRGEREPTDGSRPKRRRSSGARSSSSRALFEEQQALQAR